MLDRLVGYEVSNVAFRRIGPGTSAGRVQSVATRLVVDRERARMAFRSARTGTSKGTFRRRTTPIFPASLVRSTASDSRRARLRRRHRRASQPTPTSTLLDEAGRRRRSPPDSTTSRSRVASVETPHRAPRRPRHRSSRRRCSRRRAASSASAPARTMHVAQGLYERGLITYMRTDSTTLSDQAVERGPRADPAACTATTTCPTSRATYRSKVKNAQEAHEAIRPAGERMRTADDLSRELQGSTTSAASTTSSGSAPSRQPDGRRPHPARHPAAGGHVDRR